MPKCKTCEMMFEGPYRMKFCGAFCQMLYRIEKAGEDECWEWTGSIGTHGYGVLSTDGEHTTAHRLSYRLFFGEVEDGMFVCHRCDNRKCINPNHLFLGTAADNSSDMASKGRSAWKTKPMPAEMREKMSKAKLGRRGQHTEAQKQAASETMKKLWANPEFREQKIREATGRVHSDEARMKMRRKHSEETKEKMRLAALRREEKKRNA